ncbi:ferredoxin-nitrite reductase NirA [Gottschalkia acidurici 9a]|uniref:Ferredoxin-nitrite reductase NirA n=1 Tax=Gottschalkia acidurici (strain ATCC 7906 / DSM 604 / BCRC 14475 / CIP 104303 / KCTC 5404 / NCIMB 10678 / 9a) TaxID=1128398 RepID=K0B2Y2_GOTA9|nr:nitrite/sulfite reductase [Gottschalkia acidurici]AFS79522.1 ferredoxin-nitrite reductase NirA [Gottschalkia acidurici 9a]
MFVPPDYADDYIENFRLKIKEYSEKGEEKLNFKSFGATVGVYQERSSITYMVRPRSPGGLITLKQLKAISKIANKYSKRQIRFTTRQDIQFHKVELEDTIKIMEELKKVDVYTVGTGGNAARNVACSPLSGVELGEKFDVTPYALESTNYIVKDENSVKFPRKLKISYSNTDEDTGNSTFADLGFIAKIEDGKEKFEVYVGGGFGGGSRLSLKLEESIEPKDILYYVEAVKEFFFNEGNRENKAKARLRHLVTKLGEEEFKNRFNKYVQEAREKDLTLNIDELNKKYEELQNSTDGVETNIRSKILIPTKYDGIYSIYIHPRRGKINTTDLNKVIRFIDNLDYEVTLRITPTQGFVVRGLKGNDSEKLLEIIAPFASEYDIDNSLVCVGADTCRTGIGSSQKLLQSILTKFKNIEQDIKDQLPKLYISGCPSSCGQHLRGDIGFSGKLKKIDGELVSIYSVYFGGRVGTDAKLATRHSDILSKRIPQFLYDLAVLKKKSGYSDFNEFLSEKEEDIKNLVEAYKVD